MTKRCAKCGEEKSLEDFRKSPEYSDGLYIRCKPCSAKRKFGRPRKRSPYFNPDFDNVAKLVDLVRTAERCKAAALAKKDRRMWVAYYATEEKIKKQISLTREAPTAFPFAQESKNGTQAHTTNPPPPLLDGGIGPASS